MQKYLFWIIFLFLVGCTVATEPSIINTPVLEVTNSAEISSVTPDHAKEAVSPIQRNRRVGMEYDYSYAFSLGFDTIRPIYAPRFVPIGDASLEDDELVLGVAWDGEAKAYPISVLRYREMVDDKLAGIPTLVTW